MNKKVQLPKVVVVGRMNVGKSTLFNRLSTTKKSITMDYEGVTRDFISDVVCWLDICFELIDSGGISLKKAQSDIDERVRQLALSLIDDADVVLFVCDGKAGLLQQDVEIAKFLRKSGKEIILAVNKIDTTQAKEQLYDFERLGFKAMHDISAQHGTGIAELLESIVHVLKERPIKYEEPKTEYNVVLLGKPNVGKSSLMNLLLQKERAIVAPEAGTTREAVTEPIKFYQETILLTDTPGIRRKRTIDEPLEKLMVRSSFDAVEKADIVLLLVDGSQGEISDQELKLAFYALEKHKALIILVNKSDLITEQMQKDLEFSLSGYKHLLSKVNLLYISCKNDKNIGRIIPTVQQVWQRYSQQLDNNELDLLFKDALNRRPHYHKTNLLILRRAKQVSTAPITIILFVNVVEWFGQSQLNFFENVLRKQYDLKGVPVRFLVRKA